MNSVLVSIISDQTIPNILLMEHFREEISRFAFITTAKMEKVGCRSWIETTTSIQSDTTILVEEYNINDVISKLSQHNWGQYDRIVLNLTGGTKTMTLAAFRFFTAFPKAELYYVITKGDSPVALNINTGATIKINARLRPDTYLSAYGFTITPSPYFEDNSVQKKLLDMFLDHSIEQYSNELLFLRGKRKKGLKEKDFHKVEQLLSRIGVSYSQPRDLPLEEVEFITGGWFELYVAKKVKALLGLFDNDFSVGGNLISPAGNKNEIDVCYIYAGKFNVIECKTSIIDLVENRKTGEMRPKCILGDALYKADFLKNKFGLFASYSICTLSDFDSIIQEKSDMSSQMDEACKRADLSKVKLIDCKDLFDDDRLKKILCS